MREIYLHLCSSHRSFELNTYIILIHTLYLQPIIIFFIKQKVYWSKDNWSRLCFTVAVF